MSEEVPHIKNKPAAKIHYHAAEKIGLPKYSNVEYGVSVTRYVEDTDESIESGWGDASLLAEKFMSEQREAVVLWKGEKVSQ